MTEPAFVIHGQGRPANWVVACDHASNRVPAEDMERHIAYDIGAAGVARVLADTLDGPAVLSNFSRLVIDPNRGEDDPTLVMKLYDGTIIPENRRADAAEVERRLAAYYRPYHTAIAAAMSDRPSPI